MKRTLSALSLLLALVAAPLASAQESGFSFLGGGGSLSTPISTANGGLGTALTPVIGDILAADSTTSFARIAAPAVGQVLKSNGVGVAPSWSNDIALTGLSLGGATRGANALAATGSVSVDGSAAGYSYRGFGSGTDFIASNTSTNFQAVMSNYGMRFGSDVSVEWSTSATDGRAGGSLVLTRPAANTLQIGKEVAAPIAQTLKFGDVVAGTTNTAGVNATIQAPAGTGTGAGGSLIFQVAPAGSTGSAKNTQVTALTIDRNRTTTSTYPVSGIGFYAVGNGQGLSAGVNNGEYQASINPYGLRLAAGTTLEWGSNTTDGRSGISLVLSRAATDTLQIGREIAAPAAQTLKFGDVVAGTSNTAGVNATIQAPAGTGTGAGGSLIFQVAPAGSSGTAKNAWVTALTIDSTKVASFVGSINVAGGEGLTTTGRGGIIQAADGVFRVYNQANSSTFSITAGASNLATFNGGITATGLVTMSQGRFPSSSGVTLDSSTRGVLRNPSDGLFVLSNWAESDLTGLVLGPNSVTGIRLAKSGTTLQVKLGDSSAFTAIQGKLTTDTAYTAGDPTTTGYLLVYDSTGTAYEIAAKLH